MRTHTEINATRMYRLDLSLVQEDLHVEFYCLGTSLGIHISGYPLFILDHFFKQPLYTATEEWQPVSHRADFLVTKQSHLPLGLFTIITHASQVSLRSRFLFFLQQCISGVVVKIGSQSDDRISTFTSTNPEPVPHNVLPSPQTLEPEFESLECTFVVEPGLGDTHLDWVKRQVDVLMTSSASFGNVTYMGPSSALDVSDLWRPTRDYGRTITLFLEPNGPDRSMDFMWLATQTRREIHVFERERVTGKVRGGFEVRIQREDPRTVDLVISGEMTVLTLRMIHHLRLFHIRMLKFRRSCNFSDPRLKQCVSLRARKIILPFTLTTLEAEQVRRHIGLVSYTFQRRLDVMRKLFLSGRGYVQTRPASAPPVLPGQQELESVPLPYEGEGAPWIPWLHSQMEGGCVYRTQFFQGLERMDDGKRKRVTCWHLQPAPALSGLQVSQLEYFTGWLMREVRTHIQRFYGKRFVQESISKVLERHPLMSPYPDTREQAEACMYEKIGRRLLSVRPTTEAEPVHTMEYKIHPPYPIDDQLDLTRHSTSRWRAVRNALDLPDPILYETAERVADIVQRGYLYEGRAFRTPEERLYSDVMTGSWVDEQLPMYLSVMLNLGDVSNQLHM
jgi:hypothetical protein